MNSMPSDRDLLRLPLRALVAYSARCARRVQPHFNDWASQGDARQSRDRLVHLDAALKVAEDSAAGSDRALAEYDGPINLLLVHALNAGKSPAANAAHAAAYAARAARALARYANPAPHETFPSPDAVAVLAGHAATAAIAAGASPEAAQRDYAQLIEAAIDYFPALGAPVPAGEDGPLGPL